MRSISSRRHVLPLAIAALLLATLAGAPVRGETLRFEGDRLTVRNLIGEVRVEGSRGAGFEVEVNLGGKDARADAVRIDAGADRLDLVFAEGDYVYPALGRGGSTDLKLRDGGRVKVRSSGSGTELWADVTIRMPDGGQLSVEHGVGLLRATGVRGEAELATRSGNVQVERAEGRLSIATGSGDVALAGVSGEELHVATGSGDVKGETLDSEEIQVATGSGDVGLRSVRGREVHFATGSGDVEASGIDVEELKVGTGSGGVTLALDRLGDGDVSVGAGSGNIELRLPAGVSADVHAETDGGRIAVDLGGEVTWRVRERDEVEFTVGRGASRVRVGSGNGDIRIAH